MRCAVGGLPGFPITPASRLFYPSIDYASSGRLEIASLSVDEARFSVAGSGDVHTRVVTSDAAWVSLVGSGSAELTVDDAQVSIMGSGKVEVAGAVRGGGRG
jgi:hypothetical protein